MSSTSELSRRRSLGKGKAKAPEAHNSFGAPSSVSNYLLAAFDAGHATDVEDYYEVPSQHFLARSNGPSAAVATTSATAPTYPSHASNSIRKSVRTESSDDSVASFVTARNSSSHPLKHSRSSLGGSRLEHSNVNKSLASLSNSDDTREDGLLARSMLSPGATTDATLLADFAATLNLNGGQRPHMPDTSTLAAADFDIDVRSGFLPPEEPVRRLEGLEEELWETALDRARQLPLRIGGGAHVLSSEKQLARQWRRDIRHMLVLHPSPQMTSDIRFARRAHLVLSFLAHFYIHSQPTAGLTESQKLAALAMPVRTDDEQDMLDEAMNVYASTVPASIAVPWVAISRVLDLPPILSYATTVMWNWHLRDPEQGFTDDNLQVGTTFSNTLSEEHFYKTSLLIEKRGVAALTLMRRTLDEAFVADTLALRRIRHYLRRLARVLAELQRLLHDVRTDCDPATFYWGIRPWFNGCDSYVDKVTGEKGWIYEGVAEFEGRRMLFMGPSAGQSTLIHAIDIFLGVNHAEQAPRRPAAASTPALPSNASFMERMQTYMPGHHRNFLTHLRSISFIDDELEGDGDSDASSSSDVDGDEQEAESDVAVRRDRHPLRALLHIDDALAEDDSGDGAARRRAIVRLREAYNEAVNALKRMRDEHMRIATLYIVSQMRNAPPPAYAPLSVALTTTTAAAELASTPGSIAAEGSAKGTGGTDLVSFLKECRTNTVKALVVQRGPA